MKKNFVTKTVMALSVVALLAFGVAAFAHGPIMEGGSGMGPWGGGMRYNHGQGGWGNCPGWAAALNEADSQKILQSRNAFFKDTEQLRQQIYQKRLALAAEMAKTSPDTAALSKIQDELSSLKAQFDQKRLAFVLEMKKINPNIGEGMGFGARGRGCWRQ
jgi:Spy/CpxP family protein refolding chaperone